MIHNQSNVTNSNVLDPNVDNINFNQSKVSIDVDDFFVPNFNETDIIQNSDNNKNLDKEKNINTENNQQNDTISNTKAIKNEIITNVNNRNNDGAGDRNFHNHSNNQRKRNFTNDRYYNNNTEEEYVVNTEKVVYIKDLKDMSFDKLLKYAEESEVQNLNRMLKNDIIAAILKQLAIRGDGVYCDGILEIVDDGFAFVRYIENNYRQSPYDIYVSQNQIRRFGLRTGDSITGYVREPKRGERFFSMVKLDKINGKTFDEIKNKINFDNLTPLYPSEKLKFGIMKDKQKSLSVRVIDLISPIGKGQRALIVAPPRTGKTVLMQNIAHAISENNPEVYLIYLGIDERPEEFTEMQRTIKGEVVSSTFDEPAHRHVALAEIVIEKAKRLVEDGIDVVILLDSITRLARAYNAVAPSSGKVLTGGVDSNALQKPKRFFGAARNIEHGGSLTIIGTALVETGSKMDEVIFEEFKGTGNSEIVLDRKLSDRRLFPAIDILKSGTRKEEEMVSKEDLQKMWILRRILIQMSGTNGNDTPDALEFLLTKLKDSADNAEFFIKMNSK